MYYQEQMFPLTLLNHAVSDQQGAQRTYRTISELALDLMHQATQHTVRMKRNMERDYLVGYSERRLGLVLHVNIKEVELFRYSIWSIGVMLSRDLLLLEVGGDWYSGWFELISGCYPYMSAVTTGHTTPQQSEGTPAAIAVHSMCVCICVYMCMHACVCVCTCVGVCACVHACVLWKPTETATLN